MLAGINRASIAPEWCLAQGAGLERRRLKDLYQRLLPTAIRHRLGEYYTPDWLAQHVLNNTVGNDQMLDATLGHPYLEEMGRPLILWRNQVFAYAQMGDANNGVRLAVAYATALYEGQVLVSAVGILVYETPPTLGSGGFAWHDSVEAPVGTLTVSQEIMHLAQGAREQMPAAITSFSELAERL